MNVSYTLVIHEWFVKVSNLSVYISGDLVGGNIVLSTCVLATFDIAVNIYEKIRL